MLTKVRSLLEMIRFSHSVFALPFGLLAAVMAWTADAEGDGAAFSWRHLLGVLVCIVSARSAAMAFNRIADRGFDSRNPRTAGRHLPTGQISLGTAAAFTAIAACAFVAGTLLFWPNRLPLLLAGPVLLFLLAYSYAKRFTWLAHYWLGTALMLAPIAAWIAIRGSIVETDPRDALPALAVGLAVLFWVGGFDIIYACQDHQFDKSERLHSIPARFGISLALKFAALSHLAAVICLAALPPFAAQFATGLEFGWLYWLGVAAIAILLIYEHSLVRADDLSRVNVAFFNVNAVISIGLFVVGTLDLLWL
jgi:4-hydroxybenzoate polyprenyltransferase